MRRWLTLCLALALAAGLIPAGELAEGGRASTPLDGASAGQLENIELAAEALDGAVVKKGETFSFNEAVGPRTKESGYVSAVNGRGAKKLGGGVSQVATTLYLALKRLEGIQYLQKQTYGNQFAGGYVDSGYDAVVTDSKKGVDFRFVNGYGDFAIRIRTTDESIECELTAPNAEPVDPAQTTEAQGGEASPAPDGNTNAASDGTQANASGGNEGAAVDDTQANVSGEDDEHGNPAPEEEGDAVPVESAIEDDPDVMGSSRIRVDGPDAMLENIQLASSGIYGVVVRRGGTFSFNALVGPNTKDAGYRVAPDGRGEEVVGGGVSVIASGLWLAARDVDGIEVTKMTTYGKAYSQSYVGDPGDAVRTDYNEGVDFRFRYKGRGSITIYAYMLEGELISEIRHNNS
jgi:vancomycin resistance protein YoaR